MALSRWFLRCIPGLSLIVLFIFLECSLGLLQSTFIKLLYPHSHFQFVRHRSLLWVLAIYSLVLHIASLLFPLRLCWATWQASLKIEKAHQEAYQDDVSASSILIDDESIKSLDLSSVESTEGKQVTMAIVIPAYKEDLCTMEDTLSVLASHATARESYHIFLAMEERDPEAHQTAQTLINSFDKRFRRMQYTIHPAGIQGEAPGKSSNVSWAAKEVERFYTGRLESGNVLITTMDSDTHLLPQYFQLVREAHNRNRRSGYLTDLTLYMPPIIFDRNAHTVPTLVRVADLMWCGAGLSCFLSSTRPSSVAIPTAVYTIPLALARLVNGWDTGPDAIGEDMHMMLKCYFATNGRLRIESIPSPASQCNVSTDIKGLRGWIANHNARYKQGLRHMWGCLDTGYAMTKWLNVEFEVSPTSSPSMGPCHAVEKLMTQRPRKLSHTELSLQLSQYALHGNEARRWTWRNMVLASRLFEAHFLPAHLLTIIFASSIFTACVTPTVELGWVIICLEVTSYIRALSYLTLVLYFVFCYERYHRIGVQAREREMVKAGLHEQLSGQFSHLNRWKLGYWIDYIVFPVAGTVFGSVCLFQAALSHLYTDKLVYLVSAKPVRLPTSRGELITGNTDKRV